MVLVVLQMSLLLQTSWRRYDQDHFFYLYSLLDATIGWLSSQTQQAKRRETTKRSLYVMVPKLQGFNAQCAENPNPFAQSKAAHLIKGWGVGEKQLYYV